jgi:hypothetical protein
MDKWMPRTIAKYSADGSRTISGLAEHLRARLQTEMRSGERSGGCLIHLCGYANDAPGKHPEFYFIRNISGIDSTTAYAGFGKDFSVSEDFWKRDYLKPEIKQALSSGNAQLYLNGFPAGRVGYLVLTEYFGNFLRAIWSESRWKFRSPANLEESSMLVELQLRTIGTLFKMSDYPAPYIAGDVQMKQLAAPLDCIPF